VPYKPDEIQLPAIMHMIAGELSEPYSIYTYRYFLQNWPELCILAIDSQNTSEYIGVIICKMERESVGYIAMLAVEMGHRRRGIGTRLVEKAVEAMEGRGCDEVVLETEVTNTNALNLYSRLGFVREKRLFRYYLNGVDAFRLKLYLANKENENCCGLAPGPKTDNNAVMI